MQAHDHHGILFPDESWLDWDQTQALISGAAKRLSWKDRESKLLFRGAPTGDRAFWLDTDEVSNCHWQCQLRISTYGKSMQNQLMNKQTPQ